MNRYLKYGLIALGVLIVVLLALPLFINANSFRPTIEQKLTAALGRQVTVGNLGFSLFSGSLSADNFAIADDPKFSNQPFITAKSFKVGIEVMPLITSKQMNVTGLTIENPQLNLVRNQQGQWNFSTLGGGNANSRQASSPQSTPDFQVAKLQLKDGRATVSTVGSSKQSVYNNVDLEGSNVSLKSQFPATLTADLPGGGKFNFDGKIGPLNQTDASLTPLDAKVTIKSLDLAKTGFIDPSTGISGVADVTNTLVSNGGTAHAQGNVNLSKLQLVKGGAPSGVPIAINFAIDYALAQSSGTIKQATIKVGQAIANLAGTFQQRGEEFAVNLQLQGQNMPVTDLQAALPAVGVILPKNSSFKTGSASANLNIQGPADKAVTTGNIGLFNAQLAGFDLNSQLSAITKLTGGHGSTDTTIQKFTSNVRVTQSGIEASSIEAVVPALGTATGAGTVSASGAMNFKMVAAVNASTAVGGAAGGIPGMKNVSGGGALNVPFAIEGTTSDPKFIPDTSAIAKSAITNAAQGQLNQALGKNAPVNPSSLGGLFGKKKK